MYSKLNTEIVETAYVRLQAFTILKHVLSYSTSEGK